MIRAYQDPNINFGTGLRATCSCIAVDWAAVLREVHQAVTAGVDRDEVRQVSAGLSAGVILVEPDQTIAYAHAVVLAMHGSGSPDELGPTVDAYRAPPCLRYRNHITPAHDPIEQVAADERVGIDPDATGLLVMQDISGRKHTERASSDASEAVNADASWFSRDPIEKFANLRRSKAGRSDAVISNLTPRARQILNPIFSCLDDAAIARTLDRSRNTVRNHGAALDRKIGVHKRSDAAVLGRENGFPLCVPGTKGSSY